MNNKTYMRLWCRRLVSRTIMSAAIVLAVASAATAGNESVLGVEGSAVLDGSLGLGEWDSAPSLAFPVNLPGGGSVNGEIRAMNDRSNLYLLFRLPTSWASSYLGFSLPFEFDNDNDNTGIEEGDDVFVVNAFWYPWSSSVDLATFDDYRTALPPCPAGFFCGLLDTQEGGTNDVLAAASRAGGYVTIEIAHPLSSGDPHDFALRPGDRVGWGLGGTMWTSPSTQTPVNAGLFIDSDIDIHPLDSAPPVLQLPTGISVDATDQRGAIVYYSVSASDDADPNPAVNCGPASGGTFPIGDTIVECTATDAVGNASSGSFVVHVKGAAEQVVDLLVLVNSYQLDRLGTSLQDKLASVQSLLSAGKPRHAEESLAAFVAQVNAQRGKALNEAQAEALDTAASRIIEVIET